MVELLLHIGIVLPWLWFLGKLHFHQFHFGYNPNLLSRVSDLQFANLSPTTHIVLTL